MPGQTRCPSDPRRGHLALTARHPRLITPSHPGGVVGGARPGWGTVVGSNVPAHGLVRDPDGESPRAVKARTGLRTVRVGVAQRVDSRAALSELTGRLLTTSSFEDLPQQVANPSGRAVPAASTRGITLSEKRARDQGGVRGRVGPVAGRAATRTSQRLPAGDAHRNRGADRRPY